MTALATPRLSWDEPRLFAARPQPPRLGVPRPAGQILTPFRYGVALALALGAAAVTIPAAALLVVVFVYRAKFLGILTPADAASGFGGVVLFLAAIVFTQRLANLVPSRYLRGAARSVIEQRPAAGFDARDPEAVYVDVVPRAGWGKRAVRSFSDVGLLKVDDLARCLWFEGDQERWRVPAASLISVEVESYRGPGHVEGQQKGEVYFTTVIRARAGGAIWEAPVAKCHVELRPKGNRLREANAAALRDRIRALRPDGTLGPRREWGIDAG